MFRKARVLGRDGGSTQCRKASLRWLLSLDVSGDGWLLSLDVSGEGSCQSRLRVNFCVVSISVCLLRAVGTVDSDPGPAAFC